MEKKGPEILQQGKPWSAGPKWEEHGRLVVHTCDGVRAGNWVRIWVLGVCFLLIKNF